jgi:hypothetical protein
MSTLVKPVKCRRCDGAGDVVSPVVFNGMPGGCFTCGGDGFVEGDRATIAARKARAAAELGIRRWAVDTAEGAGMKRHRACDLTYAIDHLAENHPERYEKALTSHATGHPGLLAAIITYAAEQGFLRYGATPLTAEQALAEIGG